jgi:thiol-disulfide isomerase/thioredoxin
MTIHPRRIALTVSGFGLVLLAVAIVFFIPAWKRAWDATLPTDFSAIPTKVQHVAPALSLKDLAGKQHSLVEYKGQVVLVNLWATWCPPCKAELPELEAYYILHNHEGFSVIAVDNGEVPADVLTFAGQYHLSFPIWLDPTFEAADQAFKAVNLPSSYVIDRSGRIVLTWVGATSGTNLEKFITPILHD